MKENTIKESNTSSVFTPEWIKSIDGLNQKTGVTKNHAAPDVPQGKLEALSNKADTLMLRGMDSVLNFVIGGTLEAPEKTLRFARRLHRSVHERISPSPLEAGRVFSPSEELQQIRRLPHIEREKAVAQYKERLVYQKDGLASLQLKLRKTVLKDPDITSADADKIIGKFAQKYGFSERQVEIANEVFGRYEKKHAFLKEYRKQYPRDEELYAALFGRQPKGRVRVVEGPITFCFRCYNPEDYTYIFYTDVLLGGRPITDIDIVGATGSRGVMLTTASVPELVGAITAQNMNKKASGGGTNYDKTLKHEEEHAVQFLFEKVFAAHDLQEFISEFLSSSSDQEQEKLLVRYFRKRRKNLEWQAKWEILAHLKTGTMSIGSLRFGLTATQAGKGYPDFFFQQERELIEALKKQVGEKYTPLVQGITQQVYGTEYNHLVTEGIDSFKTLLDNGYSIEEANAILLHEPLSSWKKVTQRLSAKIKAEKKIA